MAEIHPTAFVDPAAELGEGVVIGPLCVVEADVKLGARTRLLPGAQVLGPTQIGEDCVLHPYAVLGGPPQDFSYRGEPTRLVVGDRCTIREHVTMSRGTARSRGITVVGSDGYFMNGSHVGHDCIVGDKVTMASNASLAGHVEIGEQVIVGGLAGIHQFVRVGRHAFVGALAMVTADVIPFGSVIGVHAHLAGLNVVGLKRRGFSRQQIHEMRAAYRMLFAEEGTLQERLEDVAERFASIPEAVEIVEFVRADSSRPLCLPRD
jgi:UDP-N-acetylglucosamine acyltransferase